MSAGENKSGLPALVLGAVGVVFGDIGTSPLYALKEIFSGHHPIEPSPEGVFGILSLVFWCVMLLVSLKYVLIIMRADNKGEGGSLALLALVTQMTQGRRIDWFVTMLGIFAAALFYGDSMITPAISVLSAAEGLEVITPTFKPYVIPLAATVLTILFAMQRRGTGAVGKIFGPVMVLWFGTLGLFGMLEIVRHPEILQATNPVFAYHFIMEHPWLSFMALGAVVLSVTGGEALYTDMGHFGRPPIRLAWFSFVMPALLLNYFGQGALLLADPSAISNPFFLLAPDWALVPLVVLATLATVIASQAVISGAFSVARQAVQMGFLPRMTIVHTSGHEEGQIYIPLTNWSLYLAVMVLVLGFQSSSSLAAAYGIAVTGTMMIDTILVAFVMVLLWRWHWLWVVLLAGFLLAIDLAFFTANAIKIPQGGWFPLIVGLVSFTVLTTWKRGRKLINQKTVQQSIPVDHFIDQVRVDQAIRRVAGTAVFMASSSTGVPAALLHNLKHNHILHERIFLVTVRTAKSPFVAEYERLEFEELGEGFFRVVVNFGFMEDPALPQALELCGRLGHPIDMMDTSFYLSRETILARLPGLVAWRARLFALLSRNAASATDFFHIPSNRVVELGTQMII